MLRCTESMPDSKFAFPAVTTFVLKALKDHNAALHLLEGFPLSVVFDTSFTVSKSVAQQTADVLERLVMDRGAH
jgi:hypothetical protein